jgi:signal peptidase
MNKDIFENNDMDNVNKGRMKTTITTLIGIMLCVIFIPLSMFNMVLAVKSEVNKDEVAGIFNRTPIIVESNSMDNAILEGDLIFIEKVDVAEISEGDIIAFYENDKIIAHRVVAIQMVDGTRLYTTKGDSNNTVDRNLVSEENVIGVYDFRIANMGYIIEFMQTIYGSIIAILITIAYLIFYLIGKFKGLKTNKRKQPLNVIKQLSISN